ncbi:hypothetical protein CYMTET_17107 [Cymbomonas tetramitiformis]|uniref:Uncharacterized protein n=1 Tax=Cymbomonas tetramitiformis TaxID=36881 RepID=A0AAE0GAS1_9CHLO|nr:hypothetical protein CYMTET_17107 [Cymbomonas tetramitiformis]
MATAGESARSVGESLFYDLNEDPPDFLDEVIDKDAEELPEVSDVEHLVQGVVEEVSTTVAAVAVAQTPPLNQPEVVNQPQTATVSKKKKKGVISESPWVELTHEQAANARWTRPAYEGPREGEPSPKANRLLHPEKSTPLDYFNAFIPETERYEK